jgi:hypothetical protein
MPRLHLLTAVGIAVLAGSAAADEMPVSLQVQLLSKMPTYVKTLSVPDGAAVKVLVLYPGTGEPSRSAVAVVNAVQQLGKFGAVKAEAKAVAFGDAKAFAKTLADEKPQIVYLAPEMSQRDVADIVATDLGVTLTVSGQTDHIRQGVVLGFSLVEAKPKVLVNLKHANAQGIAFTNGLMQYAVVVER